MSDHEDCDCNDCQDAAYAVQEWDEGFEEALRRVEAVLALASPDIVAARGAQAVAVVRGTAHDRTTTQRDGSGTEDIR